MTSFLGKDSDLVVKSTSHKPSPLIMPHALVMTHPPSSFSLKSECITTPRHRVPPPPPPPGVACPPAEKKACMQINAKNRRISISCFLMQRSKLLPQHLTFLLCCEPLQSSFTIPQTNMITRMKGWFDAHSMIIPPTDRSSSSPPRLSRSRQHPQSSASPCRSQRPDPEPAPPRSPPRPRSPRRRCDRPWQHCARQSDTQCGE